MSGHGIGGSAMSPLFSAILTWSCRLFVQFMLKTEDPMALPSFSMRQLIEAGCHFGHNTRRWNPKMKPYLVRGAGRCPYHRPAAECAADCSARMQAIHDVTASRRPRAVCRHQAPGPGASSRNTPSVAASITSTTVGWAARSPTGRPFPTRSSA